MKALITIIFMFVSVTSWSANITILPMASFDVNTDKALEKIETVLLNPENLLKRYKPAGATITQKSVDHNQFQFYAKKTVFLYTANVFIHSYFVIDKSNSCSSKQETGYIANMDFAGSDEMITNNVEKYQALICVQELSHGRLHVLVNAKLIKGNHYNSIVGPIISDMIAAQTNALIEAISSEVNSIK